MIAKGIMCLALVAACASCKSHEYCSTVVQNGSELFNVVRSVDTVVVQDSVMIRDSVVLRERTVHDTVYITKEVYRDTHNSSLIAHNSTQADTVRVVEYRDRVIEHPPEKYVPKFYKRCTWALWAIILAGLVYIILRWYLRR